MSINCQIIAIFCGEETEQKKKCKQCEKSENYQHLDKMNVLDNANKVMV